MPIIQHIVPKSDYCLGLWHISENIHRLKANMKAVMHTDKHFSASVSPIIQKEYYATRLLLYQLANQMALPLQGITKSNTGAPYPMPKGYFLALAHAYP